MKSNTNFAFLQIFTVCLLFYCFILFFILFFTVLFCCLFSKRVFWDLKVFWLFSDFTSYVFEIISCLLKKHDNVIPTAYQQLVPHLLRPATWEKSSNNAALVFLLQEFINKFGSSLDSGNLVGELFILDPCLTFFCFINQVSALLNRENGIVCNLNMW